MAVLGAVPYALVDELLSPWCGLQCDPARISAFDRWAVDQNSQTAAFGSDVVLIGSLVLPHVVGAIDVGVSRPADGWRGFGSDALVLLETSSAALMVMTSLKLLTRRPRPFVFNPEIPDAERMRGDAAMSFPSGHALLSFALATAYSRTFMLRHPGSPLIAPMWIGTMGIAAAAAVLRVVAGNHFPSDVLVGATLGVGIGLLVPWLHQRSRRESRSTAKRAAVIRGPLAPGGLGVMVAF
jgi:membrane-associated phospholipid phosphatase